MHAETLQKEGRRGGDLPMISPGDDGCRGPLSHLRVIDLTDEMGALCGKIFADAGADVIKVEPPGGCPTRRIPPYLDGVPGIERGLYHHAYQAGKRSLTLDLDQEEGRRLLMRLAITADFLVESFPLGHLEVVGLGYDEIAKLNPRLVYTSITPFGDKGPASAWAATDIVIWAAGGMMYLMGQPGRPPLQMAVPQAGLHAGSEAAVASMLAHLERERSGKGQKVVVDAQACVTWTLMNETGYPMLHGDILHRSGVMSGSDDVARKGIFRCSDGYVTMLVSGAVYLHTTLELVAWMDDEGTATEWLKGIDFACWTPERFANGVSADFMAEVAEAEEAIEMFLKGHTRQEIYRRALDRDLLIAPVATVEDIAQDEQLASRDYFRETQFPALARRLTSLGPFAKMSASPLVRNRPAPTLGEHNQEILVRDLGLSGDEVRYLYSAGIV